MDLRPSKSSPSHPHSPRSTKPTRISPHWFFPDGDLLLRCGSTLYLVHSRVLASASGVFRDALRRPAPSPYPFASGDMVLGADKCRTHGSGQSRPVVSSQQASSLSLSAQLFLRRNAALNRTGKGSLYLSTLHGRKAGVPKVLVVEDRELSLDYLLYFLYSSEDIPITKDLLPHVLSLGVRYQIAVLTSTSLNILRANAKTLPTFVIRTLQPFVPNISAGDSTTPAPPPPPVTGGFAAVMKTVYEAAISGLLDDFSKYHASPNARVKEDYEASVPLPIQRMCLDRWIRYVSDMKIIKDGGLFLPSGTSRCCFRTDHLTTTDCNNTHDSNVTTHTLTTITTITPNQHHYHDSDVGSGIFTYQHSPSCASSCIVKGICEERMTRQLHELWRDWWDRETTRKGRHVPRPSKAKKFLCNVEEKLEENVSEGIEGGLGWECAKGVRTELVRRMEKIYGKGIGKTSCSAWDVILMQEDEEVLDDEEEEDEEEEGNAWVGLRLDDEVL